MRPARMGARVRGIAVPRTQHTRTIRLVRTTIRRVLPQFNHRACVCCRQVYVRRNRVMRPWNAMLPRGHDNVRLAGAGEGRAAQRRGVVKSCKVCE